MTISYLVTLYRMLVDIGSGNETRSHQWLQKYSRSNAFVMGTRGVELPETDQKFDIPMTQENIDYMTVVGRGGQGLMLLNDLFSGILALKGKYANAMAAYGALQRGGGISLNIKYGDELIRDNSDIVIANTIVSFNDDICLETMLPQLAPGGTLILDANPGSLEKYDNMDLDCQVIIIPAKAVARKLYGNAAHTNLIMLGAMCAHLGIESETKLLEFINNLHALPALGKYTGLLSKENSRLSVLAGYKLYQIDRPGKSVLVDDQGMPDEEFTAYLASRKEQFISSVLPTKIFKALDDPKRMKRLKDFAEMKHKLYQLMFSFHPMVNQIQKMYIGLNQSSPLSAGDMACPGCGQINIFRTVFNYFDFLQNKKGKIYVSEQDGCGTVFTSLNRMSTWTIPYIRIAFETAHGVAAGLANNTDKDDLVVSISGDGGFMQGLRSVEDALHQQDPIFHIIVVNQNLGNTGGQATATTMTGEETSEGHRSKNEPLNLLRYAEKYNVDCAQASTVHLWDLYDKIRWGHRIVKEEKRPFMLMLNFSCLLQGMNLAKSLPAQKMALDGHFINLYSIHYIKQKNRQGEVLYYKKKLTIDWFPMTYGKSQWKKNLKEYFSTQKVASHIVDDPKELDHVYWILRGRWQRLRREMGYMRYYLAFAKSFFSISRLTMNRLISKKIPKEAE
ncbi:MAG: 2-oxoacid:acceptor oxidoreductase family protein [Lentisphaeria bacterium]|nr:2-oxoacid:acceptor oxidoreductase family protein [Lentisphaeria bacterium]